MFIEIDQNTIIKIKSELKGQTRSLRIKVKEITCCGPIFCLALDQAKQGDQSYQVADLNFIISSQDYLEYGDFWISYQDDAYLVLPLLEKDNKDMSQESFCLISS